MGRVKIESTARYIYLYLPRGEWPYWQYTKCLYSEGGLRYQVLLRMLNNGKNRVEEFRRYIILDMDPKEEELLFSLGETPLTSKTCKRILEDYIRGELSTEDTLKELKAYRIARILGRRNGTR